jgi:transcriptional regulator with XRE-family HTH domain
MTERVAFGADLKRARERRGLTLETIAEQTKVSASHFAGLERADVSRWPSGIFRRSFVRSYALAVGLDPEITVASFCRLFPDSDDDTGATASCLEAQAVPAPSDEPGSRLALEPQRPPRVRRLRPVVRRLVAATIDICVAVVPAALAGLTLGASWFWPVAASVALAGHVACFVAIGTTPGGWFLARLTARPRAPRPAQSGRTGRLEAASGRRADADAPSSARRWTPRHHPTRPSPHAHRVRH